MKKLISVLLVVVILCVLAGCVKEKSPIELTSYSQLYDSETKTIFAIGDPKEKFDKLWGEGVPAELGMHSYLDDSIRVLFRKPDENAGVFEVILNNPISERFEFYSFDASMSQDELKEIFGDSSNNVKGYILHIRFFNDKNEPLSNNPSGTNTAIIVTQSDGTIEPLGPAETFLSYEIRGAVK